MKAAACCPIRATFSRWRAATGVTAAQQWNYFDTVQYEAGGGIVSNIPAGALTITETQSSTSVPGRNVIAAAVFTPALSSGTWNGATNGNWSLSSSDNNWSGTPYSDAGSVTFPDISGKPAQNITITAGGVRPSSITFLNTTTAYAFSGGPIAGAAVVALNGLGNVTFSNSNSYFGGTTIGGGTLTAGNNAALGSGQVTVNAPGTLSFIAAGPSINGLSGGGNVVLGSTASTNLSFSTGGNSTFSGAISEAAAGLGSLTMAGSGTQTLSGSNTYSGGTTINAGTLISASQHSLGSGPIVAQRRHAGRRRTGELQQQPFPRRHVARDRRRWSRDFHRQHGPRRSAHVARRCGHGRHVGRSRQRWRDGADRHRERRRRRGADRHEHLYGRHEVSGERRQPAGGRAELHGPRPGDRTAGQAPRHPEQRQFASDLRLNGLHDLRSGLRQRRHACRQQQRFDHRRHALAGVANAAISLAGSNNYPIAAGQTLNLGNQRLHADRQPGPRLQQ